MNKRIKKLANIWANRRAEDEKLGITYTFSEKALDTFADLIVKECIDVLTASASAYDARAHFLVSEMIDRANLVLAEHFKVEE